MPKIFISYRRVDSAHAAGRIYERLADNFGKDEVFLDVKQIPLGAHLKGYLEQQIANSEVLLVVIGDEWLTVEDEAGNRRLDDPEDYVRIEIEAALRTGTRIIPVIVGLKGLPKPEELPGSIRGLASYNGIFLEDGQTFDSQWVISGRCLIKR